MYTPTVVQDAHAISAAKVIDRANSHAVEVGVGERRMMGRDNHVHLFLDPGARLRNEAVSRSA